VDPVRYDSWGLFPPFQWPKLTKGETKRLGSDDFSGPQTSRQWRFVRAGRYFWHTIKLDDRVYASAPRNSYPRALGLERLNHQLRAKFILEKKKRMGRVAIWLARPWYFASASYRESDPSWVKRCRGVLGMPAPRLPSFQKATLS